MAITTIMHGIRDVTQCRSFFHTASGITSQSRLDELLLIAHSFNFLDDRLLLLEETLFETTCFFLQAFDFSLVKA